MQVILSYSGYNRDDPIIEMNAKCNSSFYWLKGAKQGNKK